MLDTTALSTTDTATWQETLAVGDVVSFRFPIAEDGANIAPKARPCLVLDIAEIGGVRYATLAYGTTSKRRANTGYEVRLGKPSEYRAAGLHEPTRFVGKRRMMVPLDHSGFVICGATGAPVPGRVSGAAEARMEAIRGRIHAEADIAADRRQRRQRGRVKTSVAGQDFAVERRPARRPLDKGAA